MKMREVAYFLQRLDETDAIEANGRTILENSLVTISTESGDGWGRLGILPAWGASLLVK